VLTSARRQVDALAYHHQNHAGNFADAHKHWLLCLLFEQLLTDPAPLHYLETHAGEGRYRRNGGNSDSFSQGIEKLWKQPFDAPSLAYYRQQVAALNRNEVLNEYPGSPLIAAQSLRQGDHGILIEKDTMSFTRLARHMKADPRFTLLQGDGPKIIAKQLPTAGRYLLLVDPPFIDPKEFSLMAERLPELLLSHPNGIISLWYPLTRRGLHLPMLEALHGTGAASVLQSEFVGKSRRQGMYGSGMLVFRPPKELVGQVRLDGPKLAALLGCEAILEI
jgi:23S rRNA (adenine2030-N6)-methyltransferase